jgi:hypothetical protein
MAEAAPAEGGYTVATDALAAGTGQVTELEHRCAEVATAVIEAIALGRLPQPQLRARWHISNRCHEFLDATAAPWSICWREC